MKHVVGFSGGIDSQACALWVRQRFPAEDVILLNSDAGGNEHPLTTEFVEWYSANVFPVVMVKAIVADLGTRGTRPGVTKERRDELSEEALLTFDRLAYVKNVFPSRRKQFCTEHLKLIPQKRWLNENCHDGYERYTGVRHDESTDRAKLDVCEWDTVFDCYLWRPLLTWKKKQCFDFVREAGEKINPLYSLGFNRVGCSPCVNANKEDVRNWATRFPEMIEKVRRWEESLGKTFFMPCVPGMAINWIDDVVAWSKTERGGKQLSLPFYESEVGTCVSKYGLCE